MSIVLKSNLFELLIVSVIDLCCLCSTALSESDLVHLGVCVILAR